MHPVPYPKRAHKFVSGLTGGLRKRDTHDNKIHNVHGLRARPPIQRFCPSLLWYLQSLLECFVRVLSVHIPCVHVEDIAKNRFRITPVITLIGMHRSGHQIVIILTRICFASPLFTYIGRHRSGHPIVMGMIHASFSTIVRQSTVPMVSMCFCFSDR